jgi:hypothetical protein
MWPAEPWDHDSDDDRPVVAEPRTPGPDPWIHDHGREETGRLIRLACTCGHKGKWRSRTAYLLSKQLHSDAGEHIHQVRRQGA